jgi:hypothetical protein
VVDLYAVGVEHLVGGEDVVDAARLGLLLGLELGVGTQVLPVVVPEVVIGDDGEGLDPGPDEVVGQGGLVLGLSRLEVVSDDEDVVAPGELDDPRDQSVLGGPVDEGAAFEDRGGGENCGGGDLWVGLGYSFHQVLGCVVDSVFQLAEPFGIGGPEDDHLVTLVLELEVSDVASDHLQVRHLVVALQDVVGSVGLVGGDEVFVVD